MLDRHNRRRRRAEVARQVAHDTLEQRVQEKTVVLEKTNAALQKEILERKRTEDALRESERSLQERVIELEQAQNILQTQSAEMVQIAAELHGPQSDRSSCSFCYLHPKSQGASRSTVGPSH